MGLNEQHLETRTPRIPLPPWKHTALHGWGTSTLFPSETLRFSSFHALPLQQQRESCSQKASGDTMDKANSFAAETRDTSKATFTWPVMPSSSCQRNNCPCAAACACGAGTGHHTGPAAHTGTLRQGTGLATAWPRLRLH